MDFSIFELKENPKAGGITGGREIGLKTGDELERIDKAKIEHYYASDALAFNIVNKYATGILAYNGRFISKYEDEQAILNKYQNRFRLNNYLLPKIAQDLPLFGVNWNEKIRDRKTKELLYLSPRDAKYMDISRSTTGFQKYPLVDDYGRPKFYVQYLNFGQEARDKSRIISQLGKKAIKFERDELLKINLYTLGDSEDGIGIIEPMFNALKNKNEVEKATTQSILRIGNPVLYGIVGNERIMPTKQIVDEVAENLIDISGKTGFALPNYVELKLLEANDANKLTENLTYYVDQVVAAGGLPKALSTGGGEGSNKHTLENMLQYLEGTFLMVRNNIAESFEQDILKEIKEYEGLRDARYKWEKKSEEQAENIGGDE